MYRRDVTCGVPECENVAAYKIAAPWQIGSFKELKSYGLACSEHIAQSYADAVRRARSHAFSADETVGELGVYAFEKGRHDRELVRKKELETQ